MVNKQTITESIRGFVSPKTLPYPRQPSVPPEGFRGKPEFDLQKCVGCGACAQTCPMGAINVTDGLERSIRVWYGKCSFCGRCQDVCPEEAIRLTSAYELAVFDKNKATADVKIEFESCPSCGKKFFPAPQLKKSFERMERILEKRHVSNEELRSLDRVCPSCREKPEEFSKRKLFLLNFG